MKPTPLHISRETGLRLIIGLGVLLAFFLLAIYPLLTSIRDVSKDIALTRVDIERQEMLHPVYTELLGVISQPLPEGLPDPKATPLAQADIAGVELLLDEAATKAGFTTREITPDPSSLVDDSERLLVNASFQGDMAGLRNLMIELGAIPSLTHIEQVRIEENFGAMLFQFRLWLALEKA